MECRVWSAKVGGSIPLTLTIFSTGYIMADNIDKVSLALGEKMYDDMIAAQEKFIILGLAAGCDKVELTALLLTAGLRMAANYAAIGDATEEEFAMLAKMAFRKSMANEEIVRIKEHESKETPKAEADVIPFPTGPRTLN